MNTKYAYEWNTLPKYVYQNSSGAWSNFEHDIVTKNTVINPVRYYESCNENALFPMNLSIRDICFFYVFGNTTFQKYVRDLGFDLFYYKTEYDLDEDTEKVLNELIAEVFSERSYQKLLKELMDEKNRFRSEYEKKLRDQQYIDSFGLVPYSDFVIEMLVKEYGFESDLFDIYALFNRIEITEQFPLAVTPRFYKVLKGYEFKLEVPDEDCIYLYGPKGRVIVYLDRFQYSIRKDDRDMEYNIDICNCLGIPIESIQTRSEKLNGICMYPLQTLDVPIWRDVVMNIPFVSNSLVIDEHNLNTKSTKRKVIFLYHFDSDNVKTTMTLKEEDGGVRLRILNGVSQEKIKTVILTVSKALAIYNGFGNQIATEYNKLLKQNILKFTPPKTTEDIDYNKPLKVLVPEMFLPNYTRKCGFLPRIVTADEASELEMKEGFQVMKFPKPGDYPNPLLFTCEQHRKKGYIYPGLRKNTLENKENFPLLPCCYQENQRTRNTFFNKYYDSEKSLSEFAKSTTQKSQYRFLISDKFVGLDQTGKCSETIQQLFGLYTLQKPYRKGVHRSTLSALECVLVSLNVDGYSAKNSRSRLQQLEVEFETLRQGRIELCAQECWNIPNPLELLDTKNYLDPRYFIRLLEYTYQCRIVMLSRTDFIHPNFIQGYLRWDYPKGERPVVIIFEHMGSESDEATYPQCELIEVETRDENILPENIYENVYLDYVSSFSSCDPPSTSFFDILESEGYKLIGQHIDFYGKVYAINVEREGDLVTLFFSGVRVAPMSIELSKEIYYSPSLPIIIGNRSQIMIGDFTFLAFTNPVSESKLQIFEEYKLYSILLLENAKRLYSLNGNFGFIKLSDRVEDYSKTTFLDLDVVYVPNEETRDRLIYSLTLFEKRFSTQLQLYRDIQVIPFQYNSVQDFDYQSNVLIADVSNPIDWFSDFYTLKPIDGTLYTTPFISVIENVKYKCIPIPSIPIEWKNYNIIFPQLRRTYIIGEAVPPKNNTIMVIKNVAKEHKFYLCQPLPF